jgi:hypothetical protein
MIPSARLLLLAVALALTVSASVRAQEKAPMPKPAPQATPEGNGVVAALPKVPDLPASLYAPASVLTPGPDLLEVPYCVPDPLLDLPQFPPPGWFAGVELDVLKVHLQNQLTSTVQNAAQIADGSTTTVALPSAALDWAASPRVFLGYRLPAGFGEVSLAYRGLGTQGNETISGADGLAALQSRLEFHILDLDYSSREFSLLPCWDMKWTIGVRAVYLYFDSRSAQPFDQAAAGSDVLQMRESNLLFGIGPHAALEVARRLADTGLALTFRTDLATDVSRIRQRYSTVSINPDDPSLPPLAGETRNVFWKDAPMFNVQVGVSWQSTSFPYARLFLGYQNEHWWNVGTDETHGTGARANLWDSGVVMQAAFRY